MEPVDGMQFLPEDVRKVMGSSKFEIRNKFETEKGTGGSWQLQGEKALRGARAEDL